MAKFIQICASRDDLFALDEDGDIHQYNFSTKTWVKLVASRSHEENAWSLTGHAPEPGDRASEIGGNHDQARPARDLGALPR